MTNGSIHEAPPENFSNFFSQIKSSLIFNQSRPTPAQLVSANGCPINAALTPSVPLPASSLAGDALSILSAAYAHLGAQALLQPHGSCARDTPLLSQLHSPLLPPLCPRRLMSKDHIIRLSCPLASDWDSQRKVGRVNPDYLFPCSLAGWLLGLWWNFSTARAIMGLPAAPQAW